MKNPLYIQDNKEKNVVRKITDNVKNPKMYDLNYSGFITNWVSLTFSVSANGDNIIKYHF